MDTQHMPSASVLTERIVDARLRRLYDYWMVRKGERRFPARRDIDPLDFSYVLGSIMLVDALRDPLRFRVRVHGSDLVKRAGYDLTSKYLDDIAIADYRTYVIARCKGLVGTGDPVHVDHARMLGGQHRRYEALWLPLSEDGANVTMLLCGMIYQDRHW